jgi:hypothetical protein
VLSTIAPSYKTAGSRTLEAPGAFRVGFGDRVARQADFVDEVAES